MEVLISKPLIGKFISANYLLIIYNERKEKTKTSMEYSL